MAKTCSNCRHYQRAGDLTGMEEVGVCRNSPPRQVTETTPSFMCQEPIFGVVQDDQTCSAWDADHRETAETFNTSPELVDDGDMEDVGTAAWTAVNSVISKQAGTPHGGAQCLRMAYDGANSTGRCYQNFYTYHPLKSSIIQVSGWMRGDDTAIPRVYLTTSLGGVALLQVVGTSSSTWQSITMRAPWPAYTNPPDIDGLYLQLLFECQNLNTGLYVEYDDWTIKQVQAKTPSISCWGCKHFQALAGTRMGECRVQPPMQLCPAMGFEPDWAKMIDATAHWCSAWQRFEGEGSAAPDVEWTYGDVPAIYDYPLA